MGAYKTILLKISGEALKGNSNDTWDYAILNQLVSIVKKLKNKNLNVGIVIGGGNVMRGRNSELLHLERVSADFIGMMATNINGMMLENVFKQNGIEVSLYSEVPVENVIKRYEKSKALKDIEDGKVVIFSGGAGRPYLSTDTTAAMKASDIKADVILAGKNGVEGVLDKDPRVYSDAKLYKSVSYDTLIKNNSLVMDQEALKLAKENSLVIRVFNMNNFDNILKVLDDDSMGTTIRKE